MHKRDDQIARATVMMIRHTAQSSRVQPLVLLLLLGIHLSRYPLLFFLAVRSSCAHTIITLTFLFPSSHRLSSRALSVCMRKGRERERERQLQWILLLFSLSVQHVEYKAQILISCSGKKKKGKRLLQHCVLQYRNNEKRWTVKRIKYEGEERHHHQERWWAKNVLI